MQMCNSRQRFHIAGVSIKMHSDDRRSVRRDLSLDIGWTDVPRFRVTIGEDRFQVVPQGGMTCGEKCECRNNHLTTQIETPQNQHKSGSATRHCDTVLYI